MALIPVKTQGPGAPNTQTFRCTNTIIYEGAVVVMGSSGVVALDTDASAADEVVGVAAHYVDATGSGVYKDIAVYTDPEIIYKVKIEAGSTASAQAKIGETGDVKNNASAIVTGSQLSKATVDTLGTSAKVLKVVGIAFDASNAWDWDVANFVSTAAATHVLVKLNTGFQIFGSQADDI